MTNGESALKKAVRFARNSPDLVRLLGNSGWTLSGNVPVMFISFVKSILVARALGVENFGTYVLVVATVETINQLIDFRVFETTIKYVAVDLVQNDSRRAAATFKFCLGVDAFSGWLAFLVVIMLANTMNTLFVHTENGALLISLYALSLIFSTIDPTATALLRVADRFKWLGMLSVISAGLSLAITAILIWLDSSIYSVILAAVIASAITSMITVGITWHEANRLLSSQWFMLPMLPALRGRLREMVSFTLQSNFIGTLKMLATRADVLVLGYLTGAKQVGIYRLAVSLASLLAQVTDPMYAAIYPDLSRLWASQNFQRFRQLLKHSFIVAAVAVSPIALVLVLGAETLIRALYGAEFSPAAVPFIVVIAGIVVATVFFWARPAILSMGLAGIQTRLAVGVVIVQFILIGLLAPSLGALGGAVGLSSAYILGNLPLVWVIRRHIGLKLSQSSSGL